MSVNMLSITSDPSAALVTIVATNTFLPNLAWEMTYNMRALIQWMNEKFSHLATTQVLNCESQQSVALVSFKESVVGVRGEVRRATAGVNEVCPVALLLESATYLLAVHHTVMSQLVPLILHLW